MDSEVAFLGDSLDLVRGLLHGGDQDPGYRIYNGATPGCGATDGAEIETWTSPPVHESDLPACVDWSAQMEWTVQRSHPDVVVVQLGFWESQPRLWNGSYVSLSDPAYSALHRKESSTRREHRSRRRSRGHLEHRSVLWQRNTGVGR